jgi:long-chain acyl-CoA synthetase
MSLNLATIVRDAARRFGPKTAIAYAERELSYDELHERARRLAGGLAGLGVRRGDHVAVMMPNAPEFAIAYFAAHYLGAPVVPLNPQLTPDEIAYHLTDSDAVALIACESALERAAAGVARVPACCHLVVSMTLGDAGSLPRGAHALQNLVRRSERLAEPADTRADDTAVVLYTSGTTGRPKGAELTHFNLFHNADFCASHLLPMSPATVALAVLPMFHSFGQTVLQNAVLRAGGTVVLMPRFDPAAALALMQRQRVTLFAGVPTMFFAMLHHPKADRYDLSSLRHCVSGGAAMPVEVMTAFDAKYRVDILEGYGLSETSPVASFNVLNRPKRPGSIGLPIRDVEFKLVDDAGREIAEPRRAGEICIRGPNVMKGYYKRPDATAEVMKSGWFSTGDVAYRDEDGYYVIVDRKKDMIIRGGYNVYPREIEEVLYAHPAVREAAVVGVPHERHGEEVKAVIALQPEARLSSDDVIAHCRQRLAAYKYPRIVEFRDVLPKTATGKILKRELREPHASPAGAL